jgi:IS4 transposase
LRHCKAAKGSCEIYKLRWTIELFFRWLKCLLPCRHWLAESRNGVAIQVYCALIAALLLSRHGLPEISK